MGDYELALVQSLELQLLGARIHGCYLHFAQCLWSKVQSVGLMEEYREDASIRCLLQKGAAIAFHPTKLCPCFLGWDKSRKARWWTSGELCHLHQPDMDEWPLYFRPHIWNYYAHSGPRINNHLEGWHNHMKGFWEKHTPISTISWKGASSNWSDNPATSKWVEYKNQWGHPTWREDQVPCWRHRDTDSYLTVIGHSVASFDFSYSWYFLISTNLFNG